MPSSSDTIPGVFDAYLYYLQENEETFSVRQVREARASLVMRELPATSRAVGVIPDDAASDGWQLVASEYRAAAEAAREAVVLLDAAAQKARTAGDRLHGREKKDLTELVYRTFLTCAHTVEFLHARRAWEKDKAPLALERMRQVARAERENAAAALPIYQRSRWLDPALRLDGQFHAADEMIRAKLTWLDRFLSRRDFLR